MQSTHPKLKSDLVELQSLDPSIKLDIRYASTNNFVGKVIYTEARAFLQRPAAQALAAAHRELVEQHGVGVMVYDGYRPWTATCLFWEVTSGFQRDFVANPAKGSKHNRGCAVDLTLYACSGGGAGGGAGESSISSLLLSPPPPASTSSAPTSSSSSSSSSLALEMPSEFDEMTERAYPDYSGGSDTSRKNRDLLRQVMEKHGFEVEPNEWWHFNFKTWQSYEVQDIPFSAI